jgi:hypothetical protein
MSNTKQASTAAQEKPKAGDQGGPIARMGILHDGKFYRPGAALPADISVAERRALKAIDAI